MNMTYCAFENSVSDLQQLIDIIEEDSRNSLEHLVGTRSSDEERDAVLEVKHLVEQLHILFQDIDD
jgi:hypothetical protein